jgi:HSP20 family protein
MNNLTLYGSTPFDLIERMFGDDGFLDAGFRTPAIDVKENKDTYLIDVELPGVSEKDVTLEVKDRTLTLATIEKSSKTEKDEGEEADKARYIRKERKEFRFSRSFELPEDVDLEKIEARYKDGLLTIALPRKPESAPRVVQVKAA